MPTLFYPTRHTAVIAFYFDHDIEFDPATYEQRTHLLDFEEELLSADPLRIHISVPMENEERRLTFDDQMDVIEVNRSGTPFDGLT
jgi:hypothetical protein